MALSRRQNKKSNKKPWHTTVCAKCKGRFCLRSLRTHWKKCTKYSLKGERVVIELGRAVEGRLHTDASDDLVDMFAKIRENESVRLIRFDWLAVCYGNDLCLNYTPHYQHGYICAKLRATAKLLNESKSLSKEITDLSSLFRFNNFNIIIEAILNIAKFDRRTKLFGSPTTALTTVTLVNTIGDLLEDETMLSGDIQTAKNVKWFCKAFKKRVKTRITKLVAVTIAKHRRAKKPNIPTTTDVSKLSKFLNSERDECFLQLTRKYTYQNWLKLSQLTIVTILVYNRRRAGEMQNTALDEFLNRDMVADLDDMFLGSSPQKTKQAIKSRLLIRGKLQRPVPVLLKHSWDDCIEVLHFKFFKLFFKFLFVALDSTSRRCWHNRH